MRTPKSKPTESSSPRAFNGKQRLKESVVEIKPAQNKPWYETYRIPAKMIEEAGVEHITDTQARNVYKLYSDQKLDGEIFPYFDSDTGEMVYCRVRRDHYDKDKEGKYHGPSSKVGRRILYTFPGADVQRRLHLRRTTIVLVEAEKSVLACEAWAQRNKRMDIVFKATGGCQGWRDKKHDVLPDLDSCNGRKIIILLDSNVHTNSLVREAQTALVAELRSRKCEVKVASMPLIEGVNGPDDLLTIPEGDALLSEILRVAEDATIAPYSEHGLVERFTAENKDKACYVPSIGWHVWDGKRWKIDDQGAVELLCQELCRTAASECSKLPEQNRIRSRKTREAILREAQAHLAVSTEELDNDPMLLNTPSGTVDLRTGKMRAARHEDHCTKLTGVAPSDVKPKRWHQFLREITLNDRALQTYLQRLAGQCLTGDTREQEFYFFHGSGMNGKSEFTHVLMSILGEYATVAPMEAFMATRNPQHSTSIAALFGARMVAASEVEDGSRWAESRLKEITGGTPIKAHFMRQDEFSFMPQFKLVLTGNYKPRLRDTGKSMVRRLMIVPFSMQLEKGKQDKKLRDKLRAEYEGILQWAIDGCVDWLRDGLRTPRAVRDASNEYFEQQDVLGNWLTEETKTDSSSNTASSILYNDFKNWCTRVGEQYVMSQREFSQKMQARNVPFKRTRDGSYFCGIQLVKKNRFDAIR